MTHAAGNFDIYEVANRVKAARYARPDVVDAQMSRYKAEGYPHYVGNPFKGRTPEDYALVHDMALFIYKISSIDVQSLLCCWWDEYLKGAVRDQLSWSYVTWKLQLGKVIHSFRYKDGSWGKYALRRKHKGERKARTPITCIRAPDASGEC